MHVTGTSMVHVPYKGTGPGLAATLAAEVDTMFAAVAAALPQIKSERLRVLAIGGEKRLAMLPDVPTFVESGYPIKPTSWYGVLAPRATPKATVALLHEKLVRVIDTPPMRARLVDMGFEVNASTPEEFSRALLEEIGTWRKVIDAAGLKGKG
jgi:tripartite-type tricarboxylate transporter receptor subunit TctC